MNIRLPRRRSRNKLLHINIYPKNLLENRLLTRVICLFHPLCFPTLFYLNPTLTYLSINILPP